MPRLLFTACLVQVVPRPSGFDPVVERGVVADVVSGAARHDEPMVEEVAVRLQGVELARD